MRNKPLVSVIIPFLNAESFIQEAIGSVFAQNYDNWELLLVDDGSTDTSTEISLRYAEEYPTKVRYLEHDGHQNQGHSATRNLGSASAKGEYIAFLDSDDVWLPDKLEQQVRTLESQSEAGMVYGPARWWYSWTGNPEDTQREYVQELGVPPNSLIKPPKLVTLFLRNKNVSPSMSGILVRRELIERVGGCEEDFRRTYGDLALYAKIGLEAPVFVSGICWYWYRQHHNSLCHMTRKAGQNHAARLAFLNWLQEYLSRQGINGGEVWVGLQERLWPYRHPILHRMILILRRVLPIPVRLWLRVQKERFKRRSPVG